MVASVMAGANQRRNGPMKREVCSADIKSVEPMKMKPIQSRTGSQYLMKARTKNKTTGEALVLISRRAKTEAHSTAGFRATLHGTGLGRTALGNALWQAVAVGRANWGILGDCRPARSAKRS